MWAQAAAEHAAVVYDPTSLKMDVRVHGYHYSDEGLAGHDSMLAVRMYVVNAATNGSVSWNSTARCAGGGGARVGVLCVCVCFSICATAAGV